MACRGFRSDSSSRLFQLGRRFLPSPSPPQPNLPPVLASSPSSSPSPMAKDLSRSPRTMVHRSPPRFFRSGGETIGEIKVWVGVSREIRPEFSLVSLLRGVSSFPPRGCNARNGVFLSFFFSFFLFFFFSIRSFLRNFLRKRTFARLKSDRV